MRSGSCREIELKRRLLCERAADRLVRTLGPVSTDADQVNHVFDTGDMRLRRGRLAVRLRSEDGRFILSAKGPNESEIGNVSERVEAESCVDATTADQILAGALDPIAALRERVTDAAYTELWRAVNAARRDQPLQEIGQFKNRRRTIDVIVPPNIALRVEVDQTRFPNGRVDEEVEIELADAGQAQAVEAWLERQAASAGIETTTSTPKLARFYSALAEVER